MCCILQLALIYGIKDVVNGTECPEPVLLLRFIELIVGEEEHVKLSFVGSLHSEFIKIVLRLLGSFLSVILGSLKHIYRLSQHSDV